MTRHLPSPGARLWFVVVGFLLVVGYGCVLERGPRPTRLTTRVSNETVGKEFGLAPDQRYHRIHAMVLDQECATCHKGQVADIEAIFIAQDASPRAPGPVDRRACLGCHETEASPVLYGFGNSEPSSRKICGHHHE